MEVHHHAHTERKKWTHYIWEFIMLFLAVFCGFLAENIREHQVEKNREREFIISMINDLETDNTRITLGIEGNNRIVSGFDSLLQNIYHIPYSDSSLRMLYYLKETYTLGRGTVFFSKATITQLKNSGGLRLIRERAEADSIIRYDMSTERAEGQSDAVVWASQKLLDLSVKIFDGENVRDYGSGSDYRNILSSVQKFSLLTDDRRIIKEYANLAKFKKDVIINYIRQLKALQSRIPGIIQFLKNEYHLE